MREIEIPIAIYNLMIEHARSGRPLEVCGVLAGRGSLVERIYQGSNADASPVSYRLDSRQQLEIGKDLSRDGRKMLCIYHSHPSGPAFPSAKDVSLAVWDTVYIIIGFAGETPEVRAFTVENGSVAEAAFRTV